MKKRTALCTTLFLLAAVIHGQSLDELIDAAVALDPDLRRLELSRERLELQYSLEDIGPPVALSVGTGNSGLSIRTNGGADGPVSAASAAPDWQYSLQPFARVTLDGNHTVEADVSLRGESGGEMDLGSAGVGYEWDVGALGETLDDTITRAVRANARLDAEQQIRDRIRAVEEQVIQRARAVLSAEASLVEAELTVDSAADALAESLALGSASPQSAAGRELEVSLARAERVVERRRLELAESIGDLAEITGLHVSQAPRLSVAVPVSAAVDPLSGPGYAAAQRDLEIAVLRYDTPEDEPTTLSLSADYQFVPEQEAASGPGAPALHTVGGGATIGLGDWTVTLGSSVRLSDDPERVPTATTTTLGVTWSLPNGARDALEQQIDDIDFDQALIALENSERALTDEAQSLASQRRSLLERTIALEEDQLLAGLRFVEAERRLELGLVGADVLEERRAALAELEFDEQLLAYDIRLFALSVEALKGANE